MTRPIFDAVLARVAAYRANRRAVAACAALHARELAAFDGAAPSNAALRGDPAGR